MAASTDVDRRIVRFNFFSTKHWSERGVFRPQGPPLQRLGQHGVIALAVLPGPIAVVSIATVIGLPAPLMPTPGVGK